MADEFLSVSVSDFGPLMRALRFLPAAAREKILEDVSAYLIKELQNYPSQKYVSRKAAYGVTFFSAKQRKWFFAALADGTLNIPYNRTNTLKNNWSQVRSEGQYTLKNTTPYAGLVMGTNQSRHAAKIGWKTAAQVVNEKIGNVWRIARTAVDITIRKLGL